MQITVNRACAVQRFQGIFIWNEWAAVPKNLTIYAMRRFLRRTFFDCAAGGWFWSFKALGNFRDGVADIAKTKCGCSMQFSNGSVCRAPLNSADTVCRIEWRINWWWSPFAYMRYSSISCSVWALFAKAGSVFKCSWCRLLTSDPAFAKSAQTGLQIAPLPKLLGEWVSSWIDPYSKKSIRRRANLKR